MRLEYDLDVGVREGKCDGVPGGARPGDLLGDHIARPLPAAQALLRHLVSHLTQMYNQHGIFPMLMDFVVKLYDQLTGKYLKRNMSIGRPLSSGSCQDK